MTDRVRVELPDLDAVHEEARRRAFLILAKGYKEGEDRRGWIIDVRDENGRPVLLMTLAEAIGGQSQSRQSRIVH